MPRPLERSRCILGDVHSRVWAIRLLLGLAALGSALSARADELSYGLVERKVAEIRFVGNTAFESDRLKELLPFREPRWYSPFGRTTYRTDLLQVALRDIQRFYQRQGYHDARVELARIIEDDAFGDVLVIDVVEGRRRLVDRVEIVTPEPLSARALRSSLVYREGEPAPATPQDVGRDVYRLLNRYVAQGFLGVRIDPSLSLSDSLVSIRYVIDAGPAYQVGEVRIEGHTQTKEGHIRRELRLKSGDRFDLEKIARSEADLLNLGWFRDVAFNPGELDSMSATADLVVSVVERPTGFYELGVGTGDEDRFRLSGAWGDRNFLRSGRSVGAQGRLLVSLEDVLGQDQREVVADYEGELLYRNPRVFGSRFDLGASGFFRKETLGLSGVELERSGVLANTTLFTGRRSTLELEATIERVLKLPFKVDATDDELFANPRAQTRALSMVFTRDTRNDLFNPRRGNLRQLFVETAGGPWFRGDNSFNKVLATWTLLQPLPLSWVAGLRVQGGWAEAFHDSRADGVPLEDRFFAGGSNSVRGYRENSLGPRVTTADSLEVADERFLANRPTRGGNALLLVNAELRFPLPLLSRLGFGGAVFADGGNVWENWSRVSWNRLRLNSERDDPFDPTTILDWRTSVGFGIHYNTPVGPLRVDYGLPLKRARLVDSETGNVEEDPHHIWHFSFGHAF
ncbi:MAG: BamA/TamA family outer membrane protein [Gemmatimonadetes bacterium]|nr:BamA/TamA family outer membrane protein [Gemmatimonadota bacterium]